MPISWGPPRPHPSPRGPNQLPPPAPRSLISPPGPGRSWGVLALGCCADLTSLWRKRQLFLRLAELPRQQVTSPYSCMILIISHMAEGAESGAQGSGRWSPTWGAGQDPQARAGDKGNQAPLWSHPTPNVINIVQMLSLLSP